MDLWELGDIPYQDMSYNILKLLDCIREFWLWASSVIKDIISEQVTQWAFGNFFVSFGTPESIFVDE